MKKFLKEFSQFALKGNMLDMAVAVIIGGAFSGVVNSIVADLLNPIIGMLTGGVNFDQMHLQVGDATLNYGAFLTALMNFVIISLCIFFLVRQFNALAAKTAALLHLQAEPEVAEPTTRTCPYCLSEIPIKATRCAHCTSQLESVESAE